MAFHRLGGNKDQNDGNDDLAEINIIPLVDVMLVLLIIFMVAAPLSINGIKIDLPTSKAKSASVEQDKIVVSISKKGEFAIDKAMIPAALLQDKIKAIYRHRDKKDLYIRADRDVPYGRVVDVMSAAKLAGVNKISMLTQPPNKG